MGKSTHFFFFFVPFFFFFAYTALCESDLCRPYSCGDELEIRFPFRVIDRQHERCGYPGFDLLCDNRSRAVLNLPHAGEFIVKKIDYHNQRININDPAECVLKRLLNFNLADLPFKAANPRNYTFFSCSGDQPWHGFPAFPVLCLGSSPNHTVVVAFSNPANEFNASFCRRVKTVSAPLMDPSFDLLLKWEKPDCRSCEEKGGICGLKGDKGNKIGCSKLPRRGLPRTVKYGIIIGAGVPGLVCVIGLACFTCSRIRTYVQGRPLDLEFPGPVMIPQPMMVNGLDGPTIESYPKTVLGDSGRLPKPNDDGTCPICLADYQPKETLRTIPECNHYFHASCIDEWLRMNATCPVCRNSPASSSELTPSWSTGAQSSSSSSTSSS